MEAKLSQKLHDRRNVLRAAVAIVAVIVALLIWLTTRDSGNRSPKPAPAEAAAPRIVSAAQLREAAATLGQPIYWAGPMPGKDLELDELSEGGVRVRYLPEGAKAGKSSSKSLTIGSYPLPNPARSLQGFAEREGSIVRHAIDGREVVTSEQAPGSAYFVSPENSVQVEVYDPSPQRAVKLALSGQVRPAG